MAVVVGDVAGKGLPASLLMASVRASLRAYVEAFTEGFDQLGRMMQRLNVCLARDARQGASRRFFSACSARSAAGSGIARLATSRPCCSVAGGTVDASAWTWRLSAGRRSRRGLRDRSARPAARRRARRVLRRHPRSRNGGGEMFGRPAAAAALRHDGQTACQIRDRLLGDVRSFIDPVRQTDDTTLVVVRVEA